MTVADQMVIPRLHQRVVEVRRELDETRDAQRKLRRLALELARALELEVYSRCEQTPPDVERSGRALLAARIAGLL